MYSILNVLFTKHEIDSICGEVRNKMKGQPSSLTINNFDSERNFEWFSAAVRLVYNKAVSQYLRSNFENDEAYSLYLNTMADTTNIDSSFIGITTRDSIKWELLYDERETVPYNSSIDTYRQLLKDIASKKHSSNS